MPHPVRPTVFYIGETKPNEDEINAWLDHIGVTVEFKLPDDDECRESEMIPAFAAKRCYMSFQEGLNPNVTQVRKHYGEYFDNILKVGHGSVLEHTTFSLAIENVSRVFTGEMNRHRAGWAISEGSMRFIRFDEDIPWCEPPSIRGIDMDLQPEGMRTNLASKLADLLECSASDTYQVALRDVLATAKDSGEELELRKQITREIFDDVFAYVEHRYRQLLEVWNMNDTDKNFDYKKKITSCLRRIVPMGVSTGGVWTGNIRALRHVLTMRCAPAAEEEICEVFSMVAKRLSETHPQVFGDFHQNEAGYWVPKYVGV